MFIKYDNVDKPEFIFERLQRDVQIFREVPQSMVDSWTCVSVLNACSHSALVDKAEQEKNEKIVTSMVQHFLFYQTRLNQAYLQMCSRSIG